MENRVDNDNLTLVNVKTSQRQEIPYDDTMTVQDLLQETSKRFHYPIPTIRLLFGGRELKPPSALLSKFNVGKFSQWTIHVMTSMVAIESDSPTSATTTTITTTSSTHIPALVAPKTSSRKRRAKESADPAPSPPTPAVLVNLVDDSAAGLDYSNEIDLTEDDNTSTLTPGEGRRRKKEVEEKRKAKHRSHCPQNVLERIERALQQRLYLIEHTIQSPESPISIHFSVLGSTGNVYNVRICDVPHCNCPDAARGHVCKHILFVFLRVLRLPPNSPLIYQKALLQSELKEIVARLPSNRAVGSGVMASKEVIKKYGEVTGKNIEDEGAPHILPEDDFSDANIYDDMECAICFEGIMITREEKGQKDVVKCTTCRNLLHKECLTRWWTQQPRGLCPTCRSEWPKANQTTTASKSSGITCSTNGVYINLSTR